MTALRVVRAGPRTTVQDLGRRGYAHLGVPAAGAVDAGSMHAANAAVGNPVGTAVLESTLGGDVLVATDTVTLAVVGSRDGDGVTHLDPGAELRLGRAAGVYVYVAVAGGIDVPPVLGSRSYDTLSRLGPPPLSAGDLLRVGNTTGVSYAAPRPDGEGGPLRVVPGPHLDRTPPATFDALCATGWTVSAHSDRVGLRLSGERLDAGIAGIASEGLVAGAVQLPPDGNPVVFLANHPVTGGYPVIAVVAAADIGRAAQTRPGSPLRFTSIAQQSP